MKKKKVDNDVRTTAFEAVVVVLICIIVFAGILFMMLAPYIGRDIVREQTSVVQDSIPSGNHQGVLSEEADDVTEYSNNTAGNTGEEA